MNIEEEKQRPEEILVLVIAVVDRKKEWKSLACWTANENVTVKTRMKPTMMTMKQGLEDFATLAVVVAVAFVPDLLSDDGNRMMMMVVTQQRERETATKSMIVTEGIALDLPMK